MTGAERGLLLLCCPLGQRDAQPLTMAQFRELSRRAASAGIVGDPKADVTEEDLLRMEYSPAMAQRIVGLLDREDALDSYLQMGERRGIYPITRISETYPQRLLEHKGVSRPPLFFCAGNAALLQGPFVSLAGSRNLSADGAAFAARVGQLAAKEGLVLVTGGAEGADQAAMEACLKAGGSTVAFLPDELCRRADLAGSRCLLLSEGGYDLPFSKARAMMRNGYVHMMGEKTFIAQSSFGKGGTWYGALENLRCGWSRLYVHRDGTAGNEALILRGALPVEELRSLTGLN